jgi:hypothetical protein
VVLALVMALLVAWVALQRRTHGAASGRATMSASASTRGDVAAAADAASRSVAERANAPSHSSPAAAASERQVRPVPEAAARSGAAAVCGLATLPASAAAADDPVPPTMLASAFARAYRAMHASTDPEVRALGVLLDDRADPDVREGERDALARDAARSDDPRLYHMALQACAGTTNGSGGGACRLLSIGQWTTLDAGNAVPWLAGLERAGTAGADIDADTAWFHATHAVRVDDDQGLYAALVERALPADAPGWLRQRLQIRAAGVQAAEPGWPLGSVLRRCSPPALVDANRAQECDALAHLLLAHGRTLMARSAGLALGERLHWPQDRTLPMRRELQRIAATLSAQSRAMAREDCGAVELQDRWWRQVSRLGEVGAAQALALESGAQPALP